MLIHHFQHAQHSVAQVNGYGQNGIGAKAAAVINVGIETAVCRRIGYHGDFIFFGNPTNDAFARGYFHAQQLFFRSRMEGGTADQRLVMFITPQPNRTACSLDDLHRDLQQVFQDFIQVQGGRQNLAGAVEQQQFPIMPREHQEIFLFVVSVVEGK